MLTDGNSLVARDQCPRCKEKGTDTHKDNLAIYGDGHEWCYKCGYHKPAIIERRVAKLVETTTITETNKAPNTVTLPFDASVNIPNEVEIRLATWSILKTDIIKRKKHRCTGAFFANESYESINWLNER